MKRIAEIIKKSSVFIAGAIALMMLFSVDTFAGNTVDLLFTSDLHSYVRDYDKVIDGVQKNVGGFGRIKTYIDGKRSDNPDTLVIDCGDIVMGTLPQALADTEACELKLLSDMGYEVLTYGNHEFDYGAKALSDMYSIVANERELRPQFVICNIDWNQTDEYTTTLKKGMSEYGFSDYVVLEKDGVKIAITGVLGLDAIKCAPTCELTFLDPIEAVKNTVEKIKQNENPDMILCLSHSGTGSVLGDTEDENLAKKVPDLDVIVSGHTHTVLDEVLTIGNTHILSCGCYGLFVGDASFTRNSSGRWDCSSYKLQLMDETIEIDQGVTDYLDEVDLMIGETVLKDYGYTAQQVIARNNGIAFETPEQVADEHDEMLIGNLLSDAYRYYANTTPSGLETPYDIAVVPSGTIRGTFYNGDITVSDAFEALSLGIGPDKNVGYPLVSLYLKGSEIKTIMEVDASISDMMTTARLYTSGVSFEFNPNRLILNRTVDVWASPAFLEQSRVELENNRMYHIVTDSYSMSMLGAVTDMSKGLLSVVPKDKDGNPITDPMDAIIYDKDGNEVKAWVALSEYMMSFSKGEDGVSIIPDYYSMPQNRRIKNQSWGIRAMFKNTSKFFYIIMAILILFILLIVFIVRTVIRRKKKKKIFKSDKE